MYVNAPMGALQSAQSPLPPTPAVTPQVAPAAQRLLATAVSGTTPVPLANPERRPQPQSANAAATTASLLASQQTTRGAQIAVPNDAGFAAQLLAQEDMAETVLPQLPNIADMLKRIAEKKPPPMRTAAVDVPMNGAVNPQEADPIRFATSPATTLNAVMRRDVQGSVMMPRGVAAYAQAQQRIRTDERVPLTVEEE